MTEPAREQAIGASGSARQRLLVTVEKLPAPKIQSFQRVTPPPQSALESYRIVHDRKLRGDILASGLGVLVQSSGPGNWKKTEPPPHIMRIYPSFDAPQSALRRQKPRTPHKTSSSETLLSGAIVHDLGTKWEQYFVATRPARQRDHAKRVQTADPADISARAKELLAEARRGGRSLTSRDAMLQAVDEMTADFETLMRRRFGDILVDVLGIPDADSR